MLHHSADGFKVTIKNKEYVQCFENPKGDKLVRFNKKASVDICFLGKQCPSAFTAVTFLRSVITTFNNRKMGKNIYKMFMYHDASDNTDLYLHAMKEDNEEGVGQCISFDISTLSGDVYGASVLDAQACSQLDMVLIKAFNYLSPDEYVTVEEISEMNKEEHWKSLVDSQKKEFIDGFRRRIKRGEQKDRQMDSIVPTSVLREIMKESS